MLFKTIPKRWLIHTVVSAAVTTAVGAFGGDTVTEGQTIGNVRIIGLKRDVTVTKDDIEYSVNAVLLHQPGISTDFTYTEGEHLLFRGKLYRIMAVEEMFEAERLHHLEVQLCG